MKQPLAGKTLSELEIIVQEAGLQRFAAKQIAGWLYKKFAGEISEMTNLSLKARSWLDERYTTDWTSPVNFQTSKDGTKKYLFLADDNRFIETAYLPEDDRATLCVSSQVGCKMGCVFCMTGKQGFQSQLTSGEILNQIVSLPERDSLTNVVYMGMGEPLDNLENVLKSLEILTSDYGFGWSYQRITVSTIGIIPAMQQFLERSQCHLAVSLHTPFDEERGKLMPIQKKYPASEIIKELRKWDFSHQRRISFEYIMFKGVNDTAEHVKELVRLLNGLNCRINLIKFHAIPGVMMEGSEYASMEHFRDTLNEKGILATIRKSRGEDIFAACGLLSTMEKNKK